MTGCETFDDVVRRQGISRRSFVNFCTLPAAAMWRGEAHASTIARALETKPRIPLLWLHGLACACCSESFFRSAQPSAKDVVLSMMSLYDTDTLMAGAGHQAEAILEEIRHEDRANDIAAIEGNPPLNEDGMYGITGGRPFVEQFNEVCTDAKAVISWGSCASWGCVQAARPNPTRATPVHKVVTDKPIIKVPGCPPIAEVMTGVITYIATFDRLPTLDAQGRPQMFDSQRVHDKGYRRPHFDAGQFAESFDDAGARKGDRLYNAGCRGSTTYNACATVRWSDGVSCPIQSGHGCVECSEDGFWDQGPFDERLAHVGAFGVDANADRIGFAARRRRHRRGRHARGGERGRADGPQAERGRRGQGPRQPRRRTTMTARRTASISTVRGAAS